MLLLCLPVTHCSFAEMAQIFSSAAVPLQFETMCTKIDGVVLVFRDITKARAAERALHQSERLTSVGRLASTMAHEINNPLAAVTNLVYLALEATAQQDVRDYLRSADEELNRIAYVTRQTLGLRGETKGTERINLSELMDSAISVASRTRNKGIVVCPEVGKIRRSVPCQARFEQLMAHLLSNSFDAVDANGQFEFDSRPGKTGAHPTSGVRLVVADSGCGIPASRGSSLFEPIRHYQDRRWDGTRPLDCKRIVDSAPRLDPGEEPDSRSGKKLDCLLRIPSFPSRRGSRPTPRSLSVVANECVVFD